MRKILIGFAAAMLFNTADAQLKTPAPSPSQTVKQDFGLSSIELSYSRPGMKNRKIFVMGPAGVEFVYKDEVRKIRAEAKVRAAKDPQGAAAWGKQEEALLAQRYERELMNPNEALSLGSISSIVMPSDLRREIAMNLDMHLRAYKPSPLADIQREFF